MTKSQEPKRQTCDICGCEKIIIRRVTRTTQVCPHSTDSLHKYERKARKFREQTARIEAIINERR